MQATRYATRQSRHRGSKGVLRGGNPWAGQQTGVVPNLLVSRWNVQHSAENEKETQTFHKFFATA